MSWYRFVILTHIQSFCHPLATARESAIPEDPQNSEDSGKTNVPTMLPDNAQQWVLEDFRATEISNSWKPFLVAPEPQPEPPSPAEAVMEVAPLTPVEAANEAEDSVVKTQDLIGKQVLPETLALHAPSEAKEYGETAEDSITLEEGPGAVVEQVTSAFTEVSSVDAVSADETLSSESAVVQKVEEVASPACKCSTAEAPDLASAEPNESSGPGKKRFPFFLYSIKNLHEVKLCCLFISSWQCNAIEAGLLNVEDFP